MKRLQSLLTAVTLLLAGCSQYAVVKKTHPLLDATDALGQSLTSLAKLAEHQPAQSLPALLEAAATAAGKVKSPSDAAALKEYNFAVGRIVAAVHAGGLDPWKKPVSVSGGWTVSMSFRSHRDQNPANFTFEPADEFKVDGTYVDTRTIREGLGAPLVVTTKVADARVTDKFAQGKKAYYGCTAVARFQGRNCTIGIEDPLRNEAVEFGGRQFTLAADFTAPLAMSLAKEKPKKIELLRLLNPQKYEHTARLGRLEPYDPNKIPVLCVHGLMDSQATWVPLINTLRGDPEIRKRYQFWFFSYPSGWPYPQSAAVLREQLDEIAKTYPGHKKIVIIGHSMGGMITRLMLTDSGDKLWRGLFGKSPAETKLSAGSRKLLEAALIFDHRSDISRAIFMAAPLQGADMAKNWLGRLGSKLIKAPVSLLNVGTEALTMVLPGDESTLQLKGVPNSVDTLAPNNRFVKAVSTIPLTTSIPYHSIMGDRGKGDTPNSSDGLVPYWSSHLDGAVSEKIVPSGHSAQQDPQAIQEVRRILLQAKDGR